ncbi:SAP DNA-binding domain-containing protein [Tieghemostelium lacteum]|uniref:SAP DNA-binding domain-containing protein n=1 Tax=Tieghemostelium lacteum TaxID=361077 RepID=A0A151ZD40_TIELA|nr:SAP DNA-binding domain-containing protein [Tieghemostelium lacteum]|eukprot:KYQ91851.1 SAP DNA-binding domain-containing protein [Tieghemostelium lacteum]
MVIIKTYTNLPLDVIRKLENTHPDDEDDRDTDSEGEIVYLPTLNSIPPTVTPIIKNTTTKTTTATTISLTNSVKKKSKFDLNKWITYETCVFYLDEHISRSKIAAFDMDHTMIKTRSGKVHPQGTEDWMWWDKVVPGKLVQLHKQGYHVVIFTNQGGIKSGPYMSQEKYKSITSKIRNIAATLTIPLNAFIATSDNSMKKPNRSMWDLMINHCSQGDHCQPVDLTQCYFIGDAAGRPAGWKPGVAADFSSSDSSFAQTIGIDFHTPEVFFLGEKPYDANLSSLIPKAETTGDILVGGGSLTSSSFEMVIFVGYPASGKSTLAKRYFGPKGYAIINGDTLGALPAQKKHATNALANKQSVVIDNTNPSPATRQQWIELARLHGANVRCFKFQTPKDLAMHLNYFRERTLGVKHIPEMVYHIFNSNLVEPTLSEGFKEIRYVNFILQLDKGMEKQYNIPNPKAKHSKK